MERDKFMGPEEAKELGLLDDILTSAPVVTHDESTRGVSNE